MAISDEDFFGNEIIQKYLKEADDAIDEYLAARGRRDHQGVIRALNKFDTDMEGYIAAKLRHRTRKIGQGNPCGAAEKKKISQTPEAVRKPEEE
jgi:phage gp36-like protein